MKNQENSLVFFVPVVVSVLRAFVVDECSSRTRVTNHQAHGGHDSNHEVHEDHDDEEHEKSGRIPLVFFVPVVVSVLRAFVVDEF
jgi:hypothetical protein